MQSTISMMNTHSALLNSSIHSIKLNCIYIEILTINIFNKQLYRNPHKILYLSLSPVIMVQGVLLFLPEVS